MTRRVLIGLLVLGGVGAGWTWRPVSHDHKQVIGQTAQVEIKEAGMEFLGRVDTGATTTSVHAESVQVEGKMVSFKLINREGVQVEMRAPLVKTKMVRNPEGQERRHYVELTLQHGGLSKRVLANLNDRSDLSYSLLLGRNWLQDDYVVDVAREPMEVAASMKTERSEPGESRKLVRQ